MGTVPWRLAVGSLASGTDAISQNDGDLTTQPPTDPAWGGTGADTILWSGLSGPCDIQTDQWGAGALALGFQSLGTTPCDLSPARTSPSSRP